MLHGLDSPYSSEYLVNGRFEPLEESKRETPKGGGVMGPNSSTPLPVNDLHAIPSKEK